MLLSLRIIALIEKMLRTILLSLLFLTPLALNADEIKFIISGGIDNSDIKTKIEANASKILTEINTAQKEGRGLNFSVMDVNESVKQSMSLLWDVSPFVCTDVDIVEHCITTDSGYQVRNIPLLMMATDKHISNEDDYQEAVINFDKDGNVDNFYLSIPMSLYMDVINGYLEQTDLHRRQLILHFIEQYRTAYSQKDIDFIRQVFSDDQLVFTGKMKTTKLKDGIISPKLQDIEQNKEQYIKNLRRIFQSNRNIKVSFSDIEVMRHLVNPYFYGITLLQSWTCDKYHDSGYFFMLWDFTDENAPQIHVRTWQPDMLNGKPLPKEKIYSLSDFDI